MSDILITINGVQVLNCAPDGKKLGSEQDALDLIGDAFYYGAKLILIPVERLDDSFFDLKTRVAGLMIQKIINYSLRLVIQGDISHFVAQSSALKAYVYESNKGQEVWFLKDLQELNDRLSRF